MFRDQSGRALVGRCLSDALRPERVRVWKVWQFAAKVLNFESCLDLCRSLLVLLVISSGCHQPVLVSAISNLSGNALGCLCPCLTWVTPPCSLHPPITWTSVNTTRRYAKGGGHSDLLLLSSEQKPWDMVTSSPNSLTSCGPLKVQDSLNSFIEI